MKEIQLTQGKVALVDDADFDWLNQFKWFITRGRHTPYAATKSGGCLIFMHHMVVGNKSMTDHKDRNGLNNTRENLRSCTGTQNQGNQPLCKSNKSGFKGVSWNKTAKRWYSYIGINHKPVYLGSFHSAEEAALAYDQAAIKYFGEFARLNFLHLSHSTGQDSSTPAAHLDASGTRPILSIGGQPKGLSEVAES